MQHIHQLEQYLSSNLAKISCRYGTHEALRFKSTLIKKTKESAVWHIRVIIHNEVVKEVFAKHTSSDEIFWEYQFLKNLNELLPDNYKLSVAKPLFYIQPLKVLVTEKVRGVSFRQQLMRYNWIYSSKLKREYLKQITILSADWLRTFHQLDQKKDGKFINDKYFEKFDYNAHSLSNYNFSDSSLKHICDIRSLLSTLGNTECLLNSYLHGDFAPPNILVDGTSISVLDLSYNRREVIYYDISYFILSILLINPFFRPFYDLSWAQECVRTFLETYFKEKGGPSTRDMFYINVYSLRHLMSRIARQYGRYYQTDNCFRRGIDWLYLNRYYSRLIESNVRKIGRFFYSRQ